jgi:predicted  nucleic acid-binding Zn-ribbon protein
MESDEWRSPVRKLVRFFRSSRDGWKSKYQEAKREIKRLVNQVRAVEKSRGHWKQVAKAERRRVRGLERELEAIKNPAG